MSPCRTGAISIFAVVSVLKIGFLQSLLNKFAVVVGGDSESVRHVEWANLLPSPHGRVDLERDCKGVENL
jgi:hypothetical protein